MDKRQAVSAPWRISSLKGTDDQAEVTVTCSGCYDEAGQDAGERVTNSCLQIVRILLLPQRIASPAFILCFTHLMSLYFL